MKANRLLQKGKIAQVINDQSPIYGEVVEVASYDERKGEYLVKLAGGAASMVGAARAAEWGEAEGAMGVLGMALSALFMAILAPELSLLF